MSVDRHYLDVLVNSSRFRCHCFLQDFTVRSVVKTKRVSIVWPFLLRV